MSDYYKTLGVERDASPDEIKQAYRRAAAKHHPDRGGSTEDFQKVEEAYRILGDENSRRQYDGVGNPFGGGVPPFGDFGFQFNFGGNPFEDILNQFHRQQRQRVYTVTLNVTLEQVAHGSTETIQLQTPMGPRSFQIRIPQGIEDGQQVRYDGLMPDGILQIAFRINKHPQFERRGPDLYTTCKLSIYDLLLGTTVRVKTIWGENLEVAVAPRTNPGSTLRLANKGLIQNGATGSHYILISSVMPDKISEQLIEALQNERNTKQE